MSTEKKQIPDFSEEDFVSFLFSERERENYLSVFHGWNNWALAGAIVSAACAGYAILKSCRPLDTLSVIYNVSFLLALFLTYHSWSRIIRKERGVDFSKVRMLKEVIPAVKIVFVFVCAIAFVILIQRFDCFNTVSLLWIIIIFIYTSAIIVALILKEKIVPSYYNEMVLPWAWANILFDTIVGYLFGFIGTQSFRLAGNSLFTPEFEIAACVCAALVLLYYLFKLNFSDKVVRKFDEIIDQYLYAGATKEDTFHEISKNRMGFGVLDGCYKELQAVEKRTELHISQEKELDEIKDNALANNYSLAQLEDRQDRVGVIVDDFEKTLRLSESLLDRLQEIQSVSSPSKDISEFKKILDTNSRCHEVLKTNIGKAREVFSILGNLEHDILTEENLELKKTLKEANSKTKEDISDDENERVEQFCARRLRI